jgi:hypothetical protein
MFAYYAINISTFTSLTSAIDELNKLGEHRWELVCVVNTVFYFKRALPDDEHPYPAGL